MNPDANIRPSLRLLGIVLAVVPFAVAPGGGWNDPLGDLKWPAAMLGMLGCLALMLREERPSRDGSPSARELFLEPFATGALLIGAGLILSSIFSPAPGLGLLTSLREIFCALFAVALALRPARARELRWVLGALLVSMGAQSLLALAQNFLPQYVFDLFLFRLPALAARGRMIGTLGNPEYLASWLAAGFAAAAAFTMAEGPRALGTLAAWSALLTFLAIFLGGGRGAILAALAGLLLTGLLARRGGRPAIPVGAPSFFHRQRAAWAGAAALIVLAGGVWLALNPGQRRAALPGRLAELTDPHSPSMRHRAGLLVISSRMILAQPLFGAGPGRFGAAFGDMQARLAERERGIGFWSWGDALTGSYIGEAHSDPLQWWAEYGLLPLLGLIIMVVRALTAGAGALRGGDGTMRGATLALWAALVTLTLNIWVSFPLHKPVRALTFWTLLGLLAGIRTGRRPGAP